MNLKFEKYHGAGNDFILIDNRNQGIKNLKAESVKYLCDRHFGIGADGLMLLNKHNDYDFEMNYFNADGSGATMCGNGGRCIVAFAKKIGVIDNTAQFLASDGAHHATIDDDGLVHLKMSDVTEIQQGDDDFFIQTGSPHHVEFENDIILLDVYAKGKEIRYSDKYKQEGTNVDFVQITQKGIKIRTYERGVENETLACGTGAVAAAIAYYEKCKVNAMPIKVQALGGELLVSFKKKDNKISDIYLSGNAEYVFSGTIELSL